MTRLAFILFLSLVCMASFSQSKFILKVNKKVQLNNITYAPLPSFIAWFGDSFTKGPPLDGGETYPYKIEALYSIPDTVYALGGTRVCTATYAPVGGNRDLIDLYQIELTRGYSTGHMVCFAYGTNDAAVGGLVNATWKATYEAIIDSFLVHGWPPNRLLIMAAPSYGTLGAPGTANALTRKYAYEISQDLGILYYDVYSTFQNTGMNNFLFNSTNFHPTNQAQVIWANELYNYLRR